MTTATLRPNGTSTVGGWVVYGGAGSVQAALSDNSDTTYIQMDNPALAAAFIEFDTYTVPALAQIRSITPRVRMSGTAAIDFFGRYWHDTDFDGYSYEQLTPTGSIATYSLASRSATPLHGYTFAQDTLDHFRLDPATSSVIRIYELYADVVYNEAPVPSSITPSGSVTTTTMPSVAFTYTDPEGDLQERAWVRVFTAAQYGIGGFDPATSPNTWDSGELLSSATSVPITTNLANNTTYKAYVKVADVNSGGRYGAWTAGPAFTIALDPPAVPGISLVTNDDANNRVAINVQGRDNLLTLNQSSLETNTTGWAAGSNTSITRSTAQFVDGLASLLLTPAGAGSIAATTPTGLSGVAVSPSTQYAAAAQFRASLSARSCTVSIHWYQAGGASSAIKATSTGTAVTDNTSGWTAAYVQDTSPADAAFADVTLSVAAVSGATDTHFADVISLAPGTMNLLTFPTQNARLGTLTNLTGYHSTLSLTDATNSPSYIAEFGQKAVTAVQSDANGLFGFNWPTLPASPGQQYTLSMWVNSAYRARAYLSFPGATDIAGAWASPTTGAKWQRVSVTATAQAGATGVFGYVMFENSNLVNDGKSGSAVAAQLELGPASPGPFQADFWTQGGYLTSQRIILQRSADQISWTTVTRTSPSVLSTTDLSDTTQFLTVYDYEAPRGATTYYRVQTQATVSASTVASDASPNYTTLLNSDGRWWLKHPTSPALNIQLNVHSENFEPTSVETQGVFNALGRRNPIVVSDAIHGETFSLDLAFMDAASYNAFEALRNAQTTLLLQTPYGFQYWVRLTGQRSSPFMLNRAVPKRVVSVTFTEQDSP